MNIYEQMIQTFKEKGWSKYHLVKSDGSMCLLGCKSYVLGMSEEELKYGLSYPIYEKDEYSFKLATIIADQYPDWMQEHFGYYAKKVHWDKKIEHQCVEICYEFNDHHDLESILMVLEKASVS